MKNIIYIYYGMIIKNINGDKDNYYFDYLDNSYLFTFISGDIDSFKKIYRIVKEKNINSFDIILNKNRELSVNIENKNYVLLKINGILNYKYDINEFKIYPVSEDGCNWGKLWSNRLDYYELQIRELGFKYQTVLNTFGLFRGLAENAILYYNLTIDKFNESALVSVVHNRIHYPCLLKEYNNPVNFLIDYSVRDISEYIKSYMLSDEYNLDEVLKVLGNLNLNSLMFNLLYARLLYPTFYFDIFDDIILEDGNDSDIVCTLDVIEKYFDLLKQVYNNFHNRYNMFKIEWLDKIKM